MKESSRLYTLFANILNGAHDIIPTVNQPCPFTLTQYRPTVSKLATYPKRCTASCRFPVRTGLDS
jgi:hypothetical protein